MSTGHRVSWELRGSRAVLYSAQQLRRLQIRLTGEAYISYGLSRDCPTHNREGFRGPEIAMPKRSGVFRIIALEGSTTYGDHIARWEDAYPARLEMRLRDRGHRVEVINAGVPGYASWEMLLSFEFRLLDLQPDLLLVYEGINDVYPRLVRPSQYDGLATSKGLWRTDTRELPHSALHRLVAIRLGWMDDPMIAASDFERRFSADYCRFNRTYTFCDNFGQTPAAVLAANPPRYFERNIRHLIELARSHGIGVVLSSWAHYPFPIADVENGSFTTLPFVERAIVEHNTILRNIATSLQVAFVDLAASLPVQRTYWFEGMHMTAEGADAQATVYERLIAAHHLVSSGETRRRTAVRRRKEAGC